MIITCPHCGTRYNVSYEAIGETGRKVLCANCQRDWRQLGVAEDVEPASDESDEIVDAETEAALDDALTANDPKSLTEKVSVGSAVEPKTPSGKPSSTSGLGVEHAAVAAKQLRDYTRRRRRLGRTLPLARFSRVARWSIAGLLALIVVGGYIARQPVVERYPSLDGLYGFFGLDVNILGLDFADVTTIRGLRDGREMLTVKARIVGLRETPVIVPTVVIALLDSDGAAIYQWSVTPSTRSLMVGEGAQIESQLALPPEEASSVRLSFANARPVSQPDAAAGENGGPN
ncbi:hypothetical protein GCM10007989_22210 [Devosia pacifica]|uniref:Zinc finger/thioredoxin putative domain-containing protein n=1 Tax=Devosia pacifica TaxID=1335967 RepID=A0A918S8B9_9HYPH|nr:zinc-ribbon domain-containing protein [Devosia pacifica]GHA26049.1 hypothetical protein GCM10007989_22210 [Devosia pacifica]